jgi:hypothetical protein
MDRDTSLVVLAVAVVVTVAALLGDRARRKAPLAAHALIPWHALMFAGLTFALVMLVHLLSFLH